MELTNNIEVDLALNNLLAALQVTPGTLTIGTKPVKNIKKMTAEQRRERFKPLIERKFNNKYPFL